MNFQSALDQVIKTHATVTKKKPIPYPFSSIKEVFAFGEKHYSPEAALNFYAIYLSGQRASEYLKTHAYDATFQSSEAGENIVINSITLKNRQNPRRTIPIPLYGEEKKMAKRLEKHIYSLDDSDLLCTLTRWKLWDTLSKAFYVTPAINPRTKDTIMEYSLQMHPHFLRHCRAAHMKGYYRFDIADLMGFFGWASPTMPNTYIIFDWHTFTDKFDEKAKKAQSGLKRIIDSEGEVRQ